MYDQVRWVLGSIGLILCFTANSLQAAIMTFNVDLTGVASGSGHTLRVFGTITVDPALPVSAAATTSNLFFQHQTDTPISLPSNPNLGAAMPSQLAWDIFGGNLYVTRTGTVNEYFGWKYSFAPEIELLFGSGVNTHNIFYVSSHTEETILKPSGGPDGPNGFLVGTAIPEPSSALLVAGFGAVFSMQRRRRL
jgi:PEP-CTERM motif